MTQVGLRVMLRVQGCAIWSAKGLGVLGQFGAAGVQGLRGEGGRC